MKTFKKAPPARAARRHLSLALASFAATQMVLSGCGTDWLTTNQNSWAREASSETEKYRPEDSGQVVLEEALEANSVHSLNDFLASSVAQKAYFEAARTYYGSTRFNESCYNSVVKSVQAVMNGPHPQKQWFADELWKKPEGMGIYHIPMAIKSHGKKAEEKKLKAFVVHLLARLSNASEGITPSDDRDAQFAKVQALQQEILQFIETKRAEMASMSKKEQKGANQALFTSLTTDERSRSIAAFLALEALKESPLLDDTITKDADYFILNYQAFYDRITELADSLGITYAGFSQTLKTLVKTPSDLIDEPGLFFDVEIRGSQGLYKQGKRAGADIVYYPVARKFHGLFKSITNSECTRLYPSRWGTIALPDTQLHYVEQKGSFLGFIELAAIDHADDSGNPTGKIVYSPTFGAGQFGKQVYKMAENGKVTSQLAFHYWLQEVMKVMPAKAVGIAKSNSTNARNSDGAIHEVMKSPAYMRAPAVQGHKGLTFGPQMQLLKEILNAPGAGNSSSYAKPEWFFVTDVIESGSTEYRILDVNLVPPATDLNLQTVSAMFKDETCPAPDVMLTTSNFLTVDEVRFILNCLDRNPWFVEATQNQTASASSSQSYLNLFRAFGALNTHSKHIDADLSAFLSQPETLDRLLAHVKALKVTTDFLHIRSIATIVAAAAPRETALAFVKEALAVLPANSWPEGLSEVLSALTEAEQRRIVALRKLHDQTVLDEITHLRRLVAELQVKASDTETTE